MLASNLLSLAISLQVNDQQPASSCSCVFNKFKLSSKDTQAQAEQAEIMMQGSEELM